MTEAARPPGPRHRILDDLMHRDDPIAWYREVIAKYGNYVHFVEEGEDVYMINEPDLIKQVLLSDTHRFSKPYVLLRKALGDALPLTSGDYHDAHRKALAPSFLHDHTAEWVPPILRFAQETRDRLVDGREVDIYHEMNELTASVIAKAMLDVELRDQVSEIRQALEDAYSARLPMGLPFSGILMQLPLPGNLAFRDALIRLYRIVERILADRREAGFADRNDLLSRLLRMQADGTFPVTDRQLHDEIQGILLAGHETTANALAFTFYLLSQNPEAEARFHAELDEVLGGRLPTAADVPALKYTRRVFTESLRILPPLWLLGRRTEQEFQLGDYTVPVGTIVRICTCVTHMDPRFWKDPERFEPDRFRPEEMKERPKYAFVPFGGGPQVCLGEGLAWMEATLVLAILGQRWRLRRAPGPLEVEAHASLRPRHGVKVVPELRAAVPAP